MERLKRWRFLQRLMRGFVARRFIAEKLPFLGRIVLVEIDRHCSSNPLYFVSEYRTDKKTESAVLSASSRRAAKRASSNTGGSTASSPCPPALARAASPPFA